MEARSLLSAVSGGLEGWAVAFFGNRTEQFLVNASAQRRHVWCAIWSQFSLRADRITQPDDLDRWRADLQQLSSRELLVRAGFARATGFLGALAKLGWRALEESGAYLSLADALEESGPRAKLLRHLQTIDLRSIKLVANLPFAACSAKTFAAMRANLHVTPMTLRRLAWRHDRVAGLGSTEIDHTSSFVTSNLIEHGDLNGGLPFPAPPWIGTSALMPLDTPAKVKGAAQRFANCLANQMRYVWQGSAYFYELDGSAIIEFERVADLGWEIVQARGPKNQPMTWEARTSLERELGRAPSSVSRLIPPLGKCDLDA